MRNSRSDIKKMTGTPLWRVCCAIAVLNVMENPTTVNSCPSPSPPPPLCDGDNKRCSYNRCCSSSFKCYSNKGSADQYCRDVKYVLSDLKRCSATDQHCGHGCCVKTDKCVYHDWKYRNLGICRSREWVWSKTSSCKINLELCTLNKPCCTDNGNCYENEGTDGADPYCRSPLPSEVVRNCGPDTAHCQFNMKCCSFDYTCKFVNRPNVQRYLCELR